MKRGPPPACLPWSLWESTGGIGWELTRPCGVRVRDPQSKAEVLGDSCAFSKNRLQLLGSVLLDLVGSTLRL